MKEYQRKHNNKYHLPREAYNATVWIIRDYKRLKESAQAILEESPPPPDGMPKGTGTVGMIEAKALKRDIYITKIKAIENALETIPPEYRKGVWENITIYKRYPNDAAKNTYGNYKARFIFHVAINLKII